MKYILYSFLVLVLISCQGKSEASMQVNRKEIERESKKTYLEKLNDSIKQIELKFRLIDSLYKNLDLRDSLKPIIWDLCPRYSNIIAKRDSINTPIRQEIIELLITKTDLLTPNKEFINALLEQKYDSTKITIEHSIFPVFNNLQDQIGVYNSTYETNGDSKLLELTSYLSDLKKDPEIGFGKFVFYESIIDSLYPKGKKIYLYTNKNKYSTTVNNFGKYEDECLIYHFYGVNKDSLNYSESEYFLIGSNFNLEIEYVSMPKIDSIIKLNHPNFCLDCPNSLKHQKVFAKLKGFKDLYLTYAIEPNSKIDDTDTPMRALYYVKDDLVFRLWAKDIDLFGCGCL